MLKSPHMNVSLLLEMELKKIIKKSLNNTISYVGDILIPLILHTLLFKDLLDILIVTISHIDSIDLL